MRGLAAGLAALAFASSAAASGPGPRFVDRAAALPGAHVYDGGWEHFVGGGVAVFDCDADGFLDLYAAGGANPARLWRNATPASGAPLSFAPVEIAEERGVVGAYPLDVDGDGRLDLAVLRVGANRLLRGLGDCRFEEAGAAWGFETAERWSTAFSATWEPGAAWPTLAVGNYVDRADPEGPFEACDVNLLYRPDAAGAGFADPVPLDPGLCALSMLFSDWRRRGAADLRVSNDRHYYVRDGAEQMWRLSPLGLLGPEEGFAAPSIWGMGIASGDVDGDGRLDVALTSMGDQLFFYGAEDGLRPAPYASGVYAQRPHLGDDGRPSTGWHAAFGDVDNDGRLDLFIAKGNVDQMPGNAMRDPNNLLMQRPDGTFAERSVEAGVATTERARGAALADLNRDGRLDLVVVNRRAPMELWENRGDGGGWVSVAPRQRGPNGFAIGAFVELRTPDGALQLRERTVGGGHAGGVHGPAHFGLGAARAAELRVRWPDGVRSDWVGIRAGRAVEAWRGEGRGLELR